MKTKFFLCTLFFASVSIAQAQTASDCKHRILFLPQTHGSVLGGSLQVYPEDFEETAKSQFTIAKYLAQHQDLPVFSEQISSDKSMKTVGEEFKRIIPPIVKKLFPQGLPSSFNELSADQKNFLSKAGGDALSLVLGKTPLLHRVVENDQIEDKIIGRISTWAQRNPDATIPPPEIVDLIFNKRENLALDQINNFFASNPNQRDVILIFGSVHYYSFLTHPNKFPSQCILVPYKFQSAITTPYDQNNSTSSSELTIR